MENTVQSTLGKRIGFYRRQKNMTQEALGSALGVSAQAVSKWENDTGCPDISLLPQLAKLLDVTTDLLLSGEEPEEKVQLVPKAQRKELNDLLFRVVINSGDGERIRINLPMGLVKIGMETGMGVPQISGDAMKNVDLKAVLELAQQGVMGKMVEIDDDEGDHIEIFVE